MVGPDNSRAIVAAFMHAWADVIHQWDWQGRTTRDLNLRALDMHYNVDWQNPIVPPWRLVSEWQDGGCPDPVSWIEATLATMLHQRRRADIAI